MKKTVCLLAVLLVFQVVMAQEAAKTESVTLKTVEPFFYAAVEMTGTYDEHTTAFSSLYEQAGAQSLDMQQAPFGVYYNNPSSTPTEELKWEVCLTVSGEKELKAPLKLKKWDFTQVASRMYTGSYSSEEFGNAYMELFTWIQSNGYVPAGPMMEKFLTNPEQNTDGEWVGTVEMCQPVLKAQ
ncbi:MAG TPA: GyrI-like domain-containing protein [bacterium]|nr:GyrI-like domain-containing protein [bacterium]